MICQSEDLKVESPVDLHRMTSGSKQLLQQMPTSSWFLIYLLRQRPGEYRIPFIPVHIENDNREVQLQRASMLRIIEGDTLAPAKIKPGTSMKIRPWPGGPSRQAWSKSAGSNASSPPGTKTPRPAPSTAMPASFLHSFIFTRPEDEDGE